MFKSGDVVRPICQTEGPDWIYKFPNIFVNYIVKEIHSQNDQFLSLIDTPGWFDMKYLKKVNDKKLPSWL